MRVPGPTVPSLVTSRAASSNEGASTIIRMGQRRARKASLMCRGSPRRRTCPNSLMVLRSSSRMFSYIQSKGTQSRCWTATKLPSENRCNPRKPKWQHWKRYTVRKTSTSPKVTWPTPATSLRQPTGEPTRRWRATKSLRFSSSRAASSIQSSASRHLRSSSDTQTKKAQKRMARRQQRQSCPKEFLSIPQTACQID